MALETKENGASYEMLLHSMPVNMSGDLRDFVSAEERRRMRKIGLLDSVTFQSGCCRGHVLGKRCGHGRWGVGEGEGAAVSCCGFIVQIGGNISHSVNNVCLRQWF